MESSLDSQIEALLFALGRPVSRSELIKMGGFTFLLYVCLDIFYKIVGTLFEIQNPLFYILSAFITGYIITIFYIRGIDKILEKKE